MERRCIKIRDFLNMYNKGAEKGTHACSTENFSQKTIYFFVCATKHDPIKFLLLIHLWFNQKSHCLNCVFS